MKDNKTPKISLTLPTYNHMKYLPMAVESIMKQTFTDWELIIVNDGSTDDTQIHLDSIVDPRIRIFTNPENKGIVFSNNRALKECTGEYIGWLSSDNFYKASFLKLLSEALDTNPEAVLAYSSFNWVNNAGSVIRINKDVYLGPNALLIDNPGLASFLYRKSMFDEVQVDIGVCSDTDFWVRMFEKHHKKIVYVPNVLIYFYWDTDADSFKRKETTSASILTMIQRSRDRRKIRQASRSPRVCFITPNFVPDHYAGVEVYTYNLAVELRSMGIDVSVLYPQIGPWGTIETKVDDIPVYKLVHDTDISDFRLTVENPPVEQKIIEFMDDHEFDIYHFHHTFGFPFYFPRITKRCGYPTVITMHDYFWFCHRMFLERWNGELCSGPETIDKCVDCYIGSKQLSLVEKASAYYLIAYRQFNNIEILNQSDIVTVPSTHLRDFVCNLGFGVDKIQISPLGIKSVRSEDPEAVKQKDKNITFGYLGVINPVKKLDRLVRVFREFSQGSYPDIRLQFWGGGRSSDIETLKASFGNDPRISYMGPYNNFDVGEVLEGIDVGVIPGDIESYSLVAREMLSAGVSVIGPMRGGLADIEKGMQSFPTINNYQESFMRNYMLGFINKLFYRRIPVTFKTVTEDAKSWIERYHGLLK